MSGNTRRWRSLASFVAGRWRRDREWRDVPAQDLPAVLTSHRPLCWDCLIVGNLYRDHPELVVERPAH